MYEDNLEELKLKSGLKVFKHVINNSSPILPFRAHNQDITKFPHGFNEIMGDFSRICLNKSWNNTFDVTNIIDLIFSNENRLYDENLNLILKEYLIKDDSKLNILHPYLFSYIPKSDDRKSKNETEIATFFRDVFFKDIENFEVIFSSKESDNVILKLILNNIPELPDNITPPKYLSCLNFIVDVFKEDIEFIRENSNFLINNLENILIFYYFYYCSQVFLKLNQQFNIVDLDTPTRIYYLLDWEKASRSRKSLNEGYNLIKDVYLNSFVNMILIDYLNALAGTNGLFINQISDLLKEKAINSSEYLKILNQWIEYYDGIHKLDNYSYSDNFEELVKLLKEDLNEGVRFQRKYAFKDNLENMGKKYFLKRRGQYGYALNITKDFLYLITALCVKEDKIKLNDLFKEYERRGLFFDRYSKEEIVNLLNTWNLIDKKSDSGDAQYVKSIL